MRILHLTLKRGFFDMIASGEKCEEYRVVKPYWIKRFIEIHYPREEKDDHKNIPYDICYDIMVNGSSWENTIEAYHSTAIPFNIIRFKNGYFKDAPEMDVECKGISVGAGKPQWGSFCRRSFIIKLGKVISIKNYDRSK